MVIIHGKCVLSFNMGWQILVFYPEPEAVHTVIIALFLFLHSHHTYLKRDKMIK